MTTPTALRNVYLWACSNKGSDPFYKKRAGKPFNIFEKAAQIALWQ